MWACVGYWFWGRGGHSQLEQWVQRRIPVCSNALLPKGALFPSHILSKPDSVHSRCWLLAITGSGGGSLPPVSSAGDSAEFSTSRGQAWGSCCTAPGGVLSKPGRTCPRTRWPPGPLLPTVPREAWNSSVETVFRADGHSFLKAFSCKSLGAASDIRNQVWWTRWVLAPRLQ